MVKAIVITTIALVIGVVSSGCDLLEETAAAEGCTYTALEEGMEMVCGTVIDTIKHGQNGSTGSGCTIQEDEDEIIIVCDDEEEVVFDIPEDGENGEDGEGCTIDSVDTVAIHMSCPDSTSALVLHGVPGKDGKDGADGERGLRGYRGYEGDDGDDGYDGRDGVNALVGTGEPSEFTGENGDSYTDIETGHYYIKAHGEWSVLSQEPGAIRTLRQLLEVGMDISYLVEGNVSLRNLLQAGVSIDTLRSIGITLDAFIEEQLPAGALINSGFSIEDIVDKGLIGTVTDDRDGKEYEWTKIGDQIWFAENLQYASTRALCPDNKVELCEKAGMLYDWMDALQIDSAHYARGSYTDTTVVQGVCPDGWHLPSLDDWKQLDTMVRQMALLLAHVSEDRLSDMLKKSGPHEISATNDFYFNAISSGYWYVISDNSRNFSHDNIRWWSYTGSGVAQAYSLSANYGNVNIGSVDREDYFSVRCLKDSE